jgi:DNA (cytosine-5)-methyltransferase 1
MTVVERPLLPWLPIADASDREADRDQVWLRSTTRPSSDGGAPSIGIVDLFSGCGGMTLGFAEAARRCGLNPKVKLAADLDPRITTVFHRNLGGRTITGNISRLFRGSLGSPATAREMAVARVVGEVDVLLGGPPCQGNSDLNNHTRRNDPKNGLYLTMARAAETLRPSLVVIENVPPVQWDSGDVVKATENALRALGYRTSGLVLNSLALGVPQRRKRFVLLGYRGPEYDPGDVLADLASRSIGSRSVSWAIKDLEDVAVSVGPEFDRIARVSADNVKRIAYLDATGESNLPNAERPRCHRDDPSHSYKSMYGRLSWDLPAQTITTGFTSMGQGRFVHPSKSRTLTPHEAARLQTFPDWFDWGDASRGLLTTMIGNAVPPLMAVEIGLATLPLFAKRAET